MSKPSSWTERRGGRTPGVPRAVPFTPSGNSGRTRLIVAVLLGLAALASPALGFTAAEFTGSDTVTFEIGTADTFPPPTP